MRRPLLLATLLLACLTPAAAAKPIAVVAIENGVTTFDVATGTKGTDIPLGAGTVGVAVSPSGRTAYVAVGGPTPRVQFIDLASNTATESIPLPAAPHGVALSPDGSKVYVIEATTDRLRAFDVATKTQIGPHYTVGDQPRSLVVTPDGKKAFVGNTGASYSVSVVDLTGTSVVDITAASFNRPENMSISPDGKTAYAANFGTGAGGTTVTPIDTATNTAGSAITVGSTPVGSAVEPNGARLLVANRDGSSVSIVDTATRTVLTYSTGAAFRPAGIAVTPGGDRAVVTSHTDNKIGQISLPGGSMIGTPVTVSAPTSLAIVPAQSPVAIFTVSGAAAIDQPLTFNGSTSGGDIAGYSWTFGDGGTASGPVVQHAFATPGEHTATLSLAGTCAADAIFSGSGNVFTGVGSLCTGLRTDSFTRTVTIPGPPPSGQADVTILTTKAKVARRGGLILRLRCTASGAATACDGTVTITRGKKKLAKRGYNVPNGQTLNAVIKLNKRGREELKKAKRKRLTVTVSASTVQPAGSRRVATRKVRLRAS
jgi:YVTN family beta-propeller protein